MIWMMSLFLTASRQPGCDIFAIIMYCRCPWAKYVLRARWSREALLLLPAHSQTLAVTDAPAEVSAMFGGWVAGAFDPYLLYFYAYSLH